MRRFDDVQPGEQLPPLSVPVTVALIAGGAIATRDYFPGHSDLDAARALGSPHIFMNGLVQRFVEGWSGPQGRLCELKIKLGAPNYPGDLLAFEGAVTEKRESDRTVQITLKGKNSMGSHVTGTVRVHLP